MKLSELDFLSQIKKITEIESHLTLDTNLTNLDEFDSLALMSISAWFTDTFNINVNVSDLQKIQTLENLYKLIP
jgi:acyl carrier protein